jgi:hypothetical protein
MTATASSVRVPTPGTFLGKFNIRRFDISREEQCREYERIRTSGNNPNSGIVIENVRDLSETTEVADAEGNRTRTERWYVVVSWWEKDVSTKPDPPKAERGFYVEKKVQTGEQA